MRGLAARHGLEITELSTLLHGQLVAVNPVYNEVFETFARHTFAARLPPAWSGPWTR